MKKYVRLVLAFAFMFSIVLTAQDQSGSEGKKCQPKEFKDAQCGRGKEFGGGQRKIVTPQMRADRMTEELGLTNAETVKLKGFFEKQDAIRINRIDEFQKIKKDLKAKVENERKVADAELQKILGNEKFQKLQTIRTVRHEKIMKHPVQKGKCPNQKDVK
ncbi:MAG: hypothetical protein Q7U47_09615 [Paludibacter sp.]|nr:hypothetical protein [Paludibacter sp.]